MQILNIKTFRYFFVCVFFSHFGRTNVSRLIHIFLFLFEQNNSNNKFFFAHYAFGIRKHVHCLCECVRMPRARSMASKRSSIQNEKRKLLISVAIECNKSSLDSHTKEKVHFLFVSYVWIKYREMFQYKLRFTMVIFLPRLRSTFIIDLTSVG